MAAASLMEPPAPTRKPRKHVRTGIVMPAKDYKRRQTRNKMAKPFQNFSKSSHPVASNTRHPKNCAILSVGILVQRLTNTSPGR